MEELKEKEVERLKLEQQKEADRELEKLKKE
jgi:hypothetical protein